MKNTMLFALATLAAPLAMAQQTDAVTPVGQSVSKEEAETTMAELNQFLNDMLAAFESVTDRTSADAAAEQLLTILSGSADLQQKLDRITNDPEMCQAMLPYILQAVVDNGVRSAEIINKIKSNDYFGSDALREIMEKLAKQATPQEPAI